MFKNLLNFEYKRSNKEAIGFYLAFLLLNLAIGGTLNIVFAPSFLSLLTISGYGAVVIQLMIGLLMLSKRNRYKSFFNILIVLLSVLLSSGLSGGLFGLTPLAYLTTK